MSSSTPIERPPGSSSLAYGRPESLSAAGLVRFILAMAIGVGIDQWTKVLAFEKLADWPAGYPFIPGWLHFRAIENHGAVFGIAQGQRLLFVVVSIAAIAFIIHLFRCSGRQWLYQIVLGMLLAGVLGNLYDRLAFGYVRDMIYALPDRRIFGREIFPWIFNVADSLLCVGVGFMMLHSLFHSPQRHSSAGAGAKASVQE
jgi:signal peptidase II